MSSARRLLPALVLGISACLLGGSSGAHAASHTSVYRAAGWTLTLTYKQMSYGEAFSGSLAHGGKSYVVQGDWIPAGDAGGDLLRFYGFAFGSVRGLVSVATLYSTCNPNCAAARTFQLKPLGQWMLPGVTTKKSVILTVQV